jgi:hypothetical protein
VASLDPARIFRCLHKHGVQYIVIGGYAVTIHQPTWHTRDLDVVVRDTRENAERLLGALIELDAVYATEHRPPIRPSVDYLFSAKGPQKFRTSAGNLDVLKLTLPEESPDTFETLEPDALEATIAGDVQVLVASRAAIMRMKAAMGRPHDHEAIKALGADDGEADDETC